MEFRCIKNNIVIVTQLGRKIWLKWIMERVTEWVSISSSPSFHWHWGVVPPKVQDLELGFFGLLRSPYGLLRHSPFIAVCHLDTEPLTGTMNMVSQFIIQIRIHLWNSYLSSSEVRMLWGTPSGLTELCINGILTVTPPQTKPTD